MPFNIGGWEILMILGLVLLIFGPKRLPEIGRSLGKGIKEFKKSTSELHDQLTVESSGDTPAEKTESAGESEARVSQSSDATGSESTST